MGRPLNKKYFGNQNPGLDGDFGAQNQAGDAGLDPSGITSIEVNYAGDGWTTQPTYVVEDPQQANGVTAEVVPHYKAISANVVVGGTGYNLNNIITQTGGASGSPDSHASFIVNGLQVMAITLNNGGTANDVGDIFEFTHPNFSTPFQVRVTGSNAGVATGVELVANHHGIWSNGALPGNTTQAGFARTQEFGTQDTNGQGLQINFTAWGVGSVAVTPTEGDYLGFTGGTKTTSGGDGTGATLAITYGLKSIDIANPGNGYILQPSYNGGETDNNTWVYTVGPFVNFTPWPIGLSFNVRGPEVALYTAPEFNRSIFVYGASIENSQFGAPHLPVDIIKQVSSRRYKIRKRQFATLTTANYGTLTATDTSGSFSISTPQPAGTFEAGSYIIIHGDQAGAGSINPYYDGHYYMVVETNGTSTFKLKDYTDNVTTVAGTITGLTISTEKSAQTPMVVQSAKLVDYWPELDDEIAILAMDMTSSLYFVTKLTAHRALLTRMDYFNNAWLFETGASVPWTMDLTNIYQGQDPTVVWLQNFDIMIGP